MASSISFGGVFWVFLANPFVKISKLPPSKNPNRRKISFPNWIRTSQISSLSASFLQLIEELESVPRSTARPIKPFALACLSTSLRIFQQDFSHWGGDKSLQSAYTHVIINVNLVQKYFNRL